MIREKIARIIKEEISKKLKESRADQLRRELDDAVNGTDYGYTPKDTGEDSTVARGRGLEVDDEPPKRQPEETLETLPPKIEYWPNGNKDRVIYRNRKGEYHRTDGPAIEWFFGNGQVRCREFCVDGKLHRTDGPAYEYFYENGQVRSRQFRVDGKLHRTDGPAYEYFYENGQVRCREFCVDGENLTKKKFLEKTKPKPTNCDIQITINGKAVSLEELQIFMKTKES